MSNRADVLIVGGGVIGLTAAYYLAGRGVRVTVLDHQEMGREASWAGAGIIAPGRLEGAATPYDKLRALSAELYPTLSAELRERTGLDNGYRRCGGLEFPADEPIDADAWRAEGITWEPCEGPALQQLEPHLRTDLGRVYHLPDMAQVRNPRHVRALLAANAALGAVLQPHCPVLGFSQAGSRVSAVRSAEGDIAAGQILLCAGAWIDLLLTPLTPFRLGVHPVRGQIVLLNTAANVLKRIILHGHRYLVPRGDGRILVGSTEEDAGFVKSTTADAIGGLLAFASEMVTDLADAAVERTWAGLRPGSRDGLPSIGQVPGFENLWVAAGHYRSGIQLSPATGLVLAEALTGQPTSVPLDAFRPNRPPAPPARPAFRS
jgi:glycine oxidase